MLTFFKKYFQSRSLSSFEETVKRINSKETELRSVSNDDLLNRSASLKARRSKDENQDEEREEILAGAFALVREASVRALDKRPFDVQLIGGLVLDRGAIAEMATGEGKTLAAVAPAYLNSLYGRGVHVVTVNEYLARRDTVWMGQIYRLLGVSVSCLTPQGAYIYDPEWKIPETASEMIDRERDATGGFLVQQDYLRPITRREAYEADITYGTNHEFGFDYLRDNLAYQISEQVQRGHFFAIIDEVDSILIDEARTPLIIAAPDSESSDSYKTFARIVSRLLENEDYMIDEKFRSVSISPSGIEKVEASSGIRDIYAPENVRFVHYLEESLKAKALFKRDKDYVVKDGEVIIVDEFTGRMLHGRRYSGGLHQAIEAKEGVEIKQETRTYAKISIQNYFRMYEKLSGMTGTAQTSAEEFHKVYKLEVFTIPTNKTCIRRDHSDKIYKTFDAKISAAVEDIKERHKSGQPVLVGTTSISKNEIISAALSRAGIPHELLNAKNNEREGSIIAQAGRAGAVTVATNMAGRGVDIILGGNPPDSEAASRVKELGGLYVLGTERHDARRIDNQLRGRSGRQGDPGESQFYLSLDDDLLRIFGGDRIKSLMERFNLPENEPIQMGFVSRAVAEAQAKVEGSNFDTRKHLLEYDDVLNRQRTAVYKMRQHLLGSLDKSELFEMINSGLASHFESAVAASPEENEIKSKFIMAGLIKETDEAGDWRELIKEASGKLSENPITRNRMLTVLDMLWMNHLDDLEALSESVGLRAYGQRDPLVEYRREAKILYDSFWKNYHEWLFVNLYKMSLTDVTENSARRSQTHPQVPPPQVSGQFAKSGEIKVGRNDPCPCGSGKKYKKCGLINSEEHQQLAKK